MKHICTTPKLICKFKTAPTVPLRTNMLADQVIKGVWNKFVVTCAKFVAKAVCQRCVRLVVLPFWVDVLR